MLCTTTSSTIRVVPLKNKMYFYTTVPLHFMELGNFGSIIDLNTTVDAYNHSFIIPICIELEKGKALLYKVGVVNKDGYVKFGNILHYHIYEKNKINIIHDWNGEYDEVFKLIEDKINKTHGGNINYVIPLDPETKFAIFTKDGKINAYEIFDYAKPKKGTEIEWSELIYQNGIDYRMANNCNTWIRKTSDGKYFVNALTIRTLGHESVTDQIPNDIGDLLFADDTEIWNIDLYREESEYNTLIKNIATNKGVLITSENSLNLIKWIPEKKLIEEGIKKLTDLRNEKCFYALTKKGNLYYIVNKEGQLFIRKHIGSNIKDAFSGLSLALTEDGKIFTYSTDDIKDIATKNLKEILGHFSASVYSEEDLESQVDSFVDDTRKHYNIKNKSNLSQMINKQSKVLLMNCIMGTDENDNLILFVKDKKGMLSIIGKGMPKAFNGNDYASLITITKPSILTNNIC